eukprot:CAMPEP_0118919862 /NCGR_PEP_ID=MMETSP1166-20130328/18778_1 /TAXON_ID=1104430 /ORGANISM="Chrysoreinhardia sp, Strain CCMP3193" /LENGTH=245 /DNA_ID=CAMNT_0006860397 /DNA_START=215 /DNA_END=949 /DNA_ORIENTATION=+
MGIASSRSISRSSPAGGSPPFLVGGALGVGLGDDVVVVVAAAQHARVALDFDGEGDEGRGDDDAAEGGEAVGDVAGEAEEEHHAPGDGADVAPGADDGADAAEGLGLDVGHDGEGGAFAGLDEEGKDDEGGDGPRERREARKDDEAEALREEADRVGPHAAAHAGDLVAVVREEAPGGAGEQVHPAEEGGDQAGVDGPDAEGVPEGEVGGGGVVDVEFDAEAAGVLDPEEPRVDVGEADLHRVLG